MSELYYRFATPIKIVVSIVLVMTLFALYKDGAYKEVEDWVKLGGLLLVVVSYYFPDEVSSFTGYFRTSSTDYVTEPAWWVEIVGLVAIVLFCSGVLL